jgi:hypothetical protein
LSHGSTYSGGVPGFNGADDVRDGGESFFLSKEYFGVLRTEMLGNFTGKFHVSTHCLSALLKATTEGAKGATKEFGADGGHEGGVNATRKQKGQRGVGVETALDGGHHGGLDSGEMVFFGEGRGGRTLEAVKGRT